jgi:hypothetical protein
MIQQSEYKISARLFHRAALEFAKQTGCSVPLRTTAIAHFHPPYTPNWKLEAHEVLPHSLVMQVSPVRLHISSSLTYSVPASNVHTHLSVPLIQTSPSETLTRKRSGLPHMQNTAL